MTEKTTSLANFPNMAIELANDEKQKQYFYAVADVQGDDVIAVKFEKDNFSDTIHGLISGGYTLEDILVFPINDGLTVKISLGDKLQ